jgi:DNA-binding IclR family transcriptional regulator
LRHADVVHRPDEHTVGISAAGIAVRTAGGHIVAISVPAPTERFLARMKAESSTHYAGPLRPSADSVG